jgi:hypothetical protein
MEEITRATLRIEPTPQSARQTVDPDELVAALPQDHILGRDDGPPVTLDIATMLDATFLRLTPTAIVFDLADERRVDDDAFDALLGEGDIDDFDPAEMEQMEAHSGLEDASHKPLPLAEIPELPQLVLALLDVVGDWRVVFRDEEVPLVALRPPPPAAVAPPPPPPVTGPYGELAARHWATSVVRALLASEELELATTRDQSVIQTKLAYMLEDLSPGDAIPVGAIVEKLLDMNGVVELYADDDAVLALFEEHRPG